jgi:phosphatidylglycerophosphate synthase
MTNPEIAPFRPQEPALGPWSRGQALIQLAALSACLVWHVAWPSALAAVASFAALLLRGRARFTPSGRFGWANAITLLRLFVLLSLTAPANALSPVAALMIVVVVLGLDLLDGFLARARGDASLFGAHFDMETDAQLVLVITLRLWLTGMSAWVLCAGLLRYVYVLWLWFWPGTGREAPRSRLARSAFALLMCGLCAGLVLPSPFATGSVLLGTLVVTASFARSCYFSRLPS